MKETSVLLMALMLASCATQPPPAPAVQKEPQIPPPPKITQFYVNPKVVRDGQPVKLCYGVENADKLTLDPPIDRVWPSLSRCIDINPTKKTIYTLTATNADGVTVKQTADASVGPPTVHIIDVSLGNQKIHPGEPFSFCVHARNASNWKLSSGAWATGPDAGGGCVTDRPTKTTTYVISAIGAMGDTDETRVTATVE